MFHITRTFVSAGVLAFGALACGGASTPSSNTPASSGPGAAASQDTTQAAQSGAGTTSEVGAPESATATEPTAGPHGRETPAGQSATSGSDVSAPPVPTSTALNDAQIAAITDGVNSAEIEQAKLAQATTKDPDVRRFATMMIEHHGEAKKKQAALKLDTAESPLAQQLSQESKATLESLKTKSGAEFDRAYLDAQVTAHQKVLDTIDRVLQPQAQNPALRSYLTELEPKVSQHLEAARSALSNVQSRDTSGRTSSSR